MNNLEIQITPFGISGLLITITYLSVLFIIVSKIRNRIALVFSLHIIATSIWGIGSFLIGSSTKINSIDFLWHFAYSGVVFIPIFFLHSVYELFSLKKDFLFYFSYIQGIFFLFITISGKMFNSYQLLFHTIYFHLGGPYYLASFICWTTIISIAHFILLYKYRQSFYKQKKQYFALLLAIPIGFGGGSMNFLPGFNIQIYPWGNFLVVIYILILAYAIFQYQLFDIEIQIKRSILYSILISSATILYLILIISSEKMLETFLGYKSLYISIFLGLLLGVLLVPLRNRIQSIIDKIIFKSTPFELAQQNERLRQEIVQSERFKTTAFLSSGVAHEVKNPLTTIKTFTEFLPKKLDDPEFLKNYSRLVGSEVDRIDGLVHQLLDYAKPAPLVKKQTDIHKLIDDTLEFLNSGIVAKNAAAIKNYRAPKDLMLDIDPNQIKQAILNILLNAIDALPDHGQLTISTRTDENYFYIAIKDNGAGIEREDLQHIWEPFFTKKDNGTGLGLPITLTIIQNHGGRITVKSKVNKWTEFTITLPVPKKVTGTS